MRIAILVRNYQRTPFELGEVNGSLLVRSLTDLGFDAKVVCLKGNPTGALYFSYWNAIWKKFDVVYTTSTRRSDMFWYFLFSLRNGRKLYASLFDNTLEPIISNFWIKIFFKLSYKIGIFQPFAVSRNQQDYIARKLGLKLKILLPATKLNSASFKKPLRTYNLLFIGSTNDEKRGLDVIIKALPEIKRVFPKVKLIVINKYLKKNDVHPLENLAIRNRVSDIIEWQNGVFEMGKFYKNVRLLILPYSSFKYCPPVPFTVLEALSYGIPVISTPLGSIPEILPNELIVTPGDHMKLAEKVIRQLKKPIVIQIPNQYRLPEITNTFLRYMGTS